MSDQASFTKMTIPYRGHSGKNTAFSHMYFLIYAYYESSVANCGKQSLHKFLYKPKIETVILSYDKNAEKAKNLYTNSQRCVLPVFFPVNLLLP